MGLANTDTRGSRCLTHLAFELVVQVLCHGIRKRAAIGEGSAFVFHLEHSLAFRGKRVVAVAPGFAELSVPALNTEL